MTARARAFVALLLALLVVGGLTDSLAFRDSVGHGEGPARPLTVRQQVAAATDDGAARVLRLTDLSDLFPEHFGHYRAIRERAPGAVVVVDSGILDEVGLRTLGGATQVVQADLSQVPFPDLREGSSPDHRGRRWAILAADGPATVLYVRSLDGVTTIVDGRILDLEPLEEPAGGAATAAPHEVAPGISRGILFDALIGLWFMLLGGLVVPRSVGPGASRAAAGFLLGAAIQASLGLLLIPPGWTLVVGAAGITALASALRARGFDVGWRREDATSAALFAGLLAAGAVVARVAGAIFVTFDSFDYLGQAQLLAEGGLRPDLIDLKRGVGLPSIHALGFMAGAEGFQSFGALVLVAAATLLAGAAARARVTTPARYLPALLVVAAVVATPQVRTHAMYINSHLLVAALLLLLVLLLELEQDDEPGADAFRDRLPGLATVAVALVHLRVEGALLVAFVLLGAFSRSAGPPADRASLRALWVPTGVATLGWASLLGGSRLATGRPPSTAEIGLAALGITLVVLPSLLRALPEAVGRQVPAVALIGVWTAAVAVILLGDAAGFLIAATDNLFGGFGGWGSAAPLLVVAAVLASVLRTDRELGSGLGPGALLVLAFPPLLLLAKAGDGLSDDGSTVGGLLRVGGRVGWGDSTSRMWMHVLFVVLLLVVLRAASTSVRLTMPATSTVILAALVATMLWDPHYVPDPSSDRAAGVRTIAVEDWSGTRPFGEVLPGSRLTQRIAVGAQAFPAGAPPEARICINPLVATYARTPAGSLDLRLDAPGSRGAERRVDLGEVTDWSRITVCSDRPFDGRAATELTLTVTGVDSPPGAAVTFLAADEAWGSPAELGALGPAGDGARGPMALSITLEWTDQRLAAAQAASRWLPGLTVALLLGIAVWTVVRARRQDGSGDAPEPDGPPAAVRG